MTQLFDFSLAKSYFHISPEGAHNPLEEMPATDFLYNPLRIKEMMLAAGKTVQAYGLDLPASFFGTSFCNLCLTKLLFLTQYNKVLDLSLENLTFQIEVHNDHSHLGYKINELQYQDVPIEEEESFVLDDWQTFISSVVTPAVESIAQVADVKPSMIWLQFGGILGMVKDYMSKNERNEEIIARFNRQADLLSESLSPELFHRLRNPFKHKIRYTDNPYQPGEQFIMRSACCLYDCRNNGKKCYVCPRLTEKEREKRKEEILASL
ncbi:hypothetical protein [Bacillus massiliigorillae]|uniref:hypothetical protein n=1 Tax=Bacillus massiliigorillae TaxID=1243664 RepID=UPI0003AA0788|nr:hypothetical protein [Bacillus massiliigorillae]